MKSEIIFFDIDDTLIDSTTHQMPESTRAALLALRKNKHKLCISTGRSMTPTGMNGIPDDIRAFHWDGWVCCNGQFVFDQDKNVLFEQFMPADIIQELCALCQRINCSLELKTASGSYFTNFISPFATQTYDFFHLPIHPIQSYQGEPVMSAMVFGPQNWDYSPFRNIPDLDVIPGRSTYADLVVSGINKATGNLYLAHHLGHSDYIAFGDSLNDMDMLASAKIGIAMGQGENDLKSIADHVTTSVNHHGIWNACVNLGLINEKIRFS